MGNKTGKLIIKVLYISFAAIICIFTGMIFFNTAKGDHIIKLTNDYIAAKDYENIQVLFGGLYYDIPSVDESKDDLKLIVSASAAENNFLYYPDETEKKGVLYHGFNKAYNFYIFNSKFSSADTLEDNNIKVNSTGIEFVSSKLDDNGNALTYLFPFRISANSNAEFYNTKPKSISEYALNYARDFISDRTRYGFYNFQITEETIKAIKEKLDGDIVSFNIIDNEKTKVFESNINFGFNFDELFYNDDQAGIVFNAYKDYLPYYDSYKLAKKYTITNKIEVSKEVYQKKTETFNNTLDNFNADLNAGNKFDSHVKMALQEKEIFTGSVVAKAVWRTIGIEALVVLVLFVIYVLLFHFQKLRDFIFRNDRKTVIRAKIVNKEPEQKPESFAYDQSGKNKPEVKQIEENKNVDKIDDMSNKEDKKDIEE